MQTKKLPWQRHNKPQATLTVFNGHIHNPKLTTIQMVMVLLQWQCSEVWESDRDEYVIVPVAWYTYGPIKLNFMILQSLFLNTTPKHFKFPNLQNFQTMHQLYHVFKVWYLLCASTIHNNTTNVACQCTPLLQQLYVAATCFSYKVAIIRLFMWEV